MKILSNALAIALSSIAFGQAKLAVYEHGKLVGRMTVSVKIAADGSKIDEMSMSRMGQGKAVDLRVISSFAADGTPTRKFMAMSLVGTSERHQTVVTFTENAAHIHFVPETASEDREVPLPRGSQFKQPQEFWFIRDHPDPGASSTSCVFELASGKWIDHVQTFVGDRQIVIGNKTMTAHKITSVMAGRTITEYLDSKGLPLKIEQGDLIFERTGL